MIEKAVDFFLHEWKLVLALAVTIAIGGLISIRSLDIEAYPDPAPPILEVITQNPSWSAEEMEQQITVPLETQLNGMPGLEHMRSISLFGLSDIKCYFSYDTDYLADRQEVINRIGMATLPQGIQAQLSPESTIGEIYRYQVVGDSRYTLRDLKEIQDWVLVRTFKQVPGVVDVAGFGGPTKQFHVDLDPRQLIAYHVSVPQVMTALSNGNANAGAYYIDIGAQSYNVRGIGLFKTLEDIENVVVAEKNGVPVYVRQLGRVSIGRAVPLGRVGRDGMEDIVQGIVLMRVGEKSLPTIQGVKRMADKLNGSILPPGVKIVPYVDRSDLIAITTHTVEHTLVSGMCLVVFILLAFLGDLRAALIVSLTIPLSLCFVFIIMVLRGDSANLISMGAIDFGIIVDASVIMVENIHRHLTSRSGQLTNVRLITSEAAKEVVSPIFFSTIVIFVSFLPLFTMRGVEGKIFGPMALTYGLALLGALILAFTFSPVAASLFLKKEAHHETLLVRTIRAPYTRILRLCVRHPLITVLAALAALVGTLLTVPSLGGEFMPHLEEGNLWVRATMPLSISYNYASDVANEVRAVFDSYPEVTTVVSQLGRPDDGTDATSYFNCEFYVGLKPREQWPGGQTKDELVNRMNERLARVLPGIIFNFSQTIEDNVEEAMSGVKGENSVKIFGRDLETLEHLASQIERIMKGVRGVEDLGVFHELGQPNLLIKADRKAAARYNLQVADVNAIVSAAIGGSAATQVLDADRRFDVVVRLLQPYRRSVDSIKRIPIVSPDGEALPLGAVADVQFRSGAGFIYREDNDRYIPVKFSVRGRDLKSTIAEAREKIGREVRFPPGYHTEWSGEVEELEQAINRLKVIVPITLVIILFLLNKTFNNTIDAVLILLVVPMASIGGIWALFLRQIPFSVSAAVGFISLFGVCTLEGVLLVSRIKVALVEGLQPYDAIIAGSELRLRPVLMVALGAAIGLFPASIATGIGSETQRPLATVVVGGMMTSAIVILLVLPAIYRLLHRRQQHASMAKPATHDFTLDEE